MGLPMMERGQVEGGEVGRGVGVTYGRGRKTVRLSRTRRARKLVTKLILTDWCLGLLSSLNYDTLLSVTVLLLLFIWQRIMRIRVDINEDRPGTVLIRQHNFLGIHTKECRFTKRNVLFVRTV